MEKSRCDLDKKIISTLLAVLKASRKLLFRNCKQLYIIYIPMANREIVAGNTLFKIRIKFNITAYKYNEWYQDKKYALCEVSVRNLNVVLMLNSDEYALLRNTNWHKYQK